MKNHYILSVFPLRALNLQGVKETTVQEQHSIQLHSNEDLGISPSTVV